MDFYTNKKSKTNPEVSLAMLQAAIPALEALPEWTQDAIHDALIDLAAKLEVKNATLMWPGPHRCRRQVGDSRRCRGDLPHSGP